MTSETADPRPINDQGQAPTHPQDTSPRLKAEALRCAQRGWHVFPVRPIKNGVCTCSKGAACTSPGKHPRNSNGVKEATTDTRAILDWSTKWPDANIGVATGAVSGLFVLDVDPRNGGDDSLDMLISQHGPLPDTVEVLTGGGGRHIYFAYDGVEGIKNSSSKLGPGLDIKTNGGYIVAPPSMHISGRRYEWEASSHPNDQAVALPPKWLVDALSEGTASALGSAVSTGRVRLDSPVTVLAGVPEGDRNHALFRLASRHQGLRLGLDEATALALVAAAACDPPLPDAEARRIVANVYGRYEDDRDPNHIPVGGLSLTSTAANFSIFWGNEVEELPKPEWLIDGIMPKGSFVVMYGEPGTGKTFIALDQAGAIASGQPWQGHRTSKGPVVYIAAEGIGDLGLRHEALRIGRGLGDLPDIGYITEPVNLHADSEVGYLLDLIKDRGPALIVADTLARSMDGADESFAKDMNAVIKNVDRLRHTTGAAVQLLHHPGRDRRSERGSTALKGASDVVIKVTGGVAKATTLHCDKAKMNVAFGDITVHFEATGSSLSVVSRGLAPTLTDPQRNSLTLVSEESLTHTQWLEAFKKAGHGSKSTFVRTLEPLKEQGFVENGDGGRGNPYGITRLGQEALGVIAPTKVSEKK